MNMNKKKFILIVLFLLLFTSLTVVDASTTTLKHTYVGVDFCSEDAVQKILRLAGYVVVLAKVAVPLILVVLGTIDLYKAVTIGEKELTKSLKTFMLRIFAGIFIFFIPNIVDFSFDLIFENSGGNVQNQCITCVLDPFNC